MFAKHCITFRGFVEGSHESHVFCTRSISRSCLFCRKLTSRNTRILQKGDLNELLHFVEGWLREVYVFCRRTTSRNTRILVIVNGKTSSSGWRTRWSTSRNWFSCHRYGCGSHPVRTRKDQDNALSGPARTLVSLLTKLNLLPPTQDVAANSLSSGDPQQHVAIEKCDA